MNSENNSKPYSGREFEIFNLDYQGLCNFDDIIGNKEMMNLWNKIKLKHKSELWAGEYKNKLTFYHRIWIWY